MTANCYLCSLLSLSLHLLHSGSCVPRIPSSTMQQKEQQKDVYAQSAPADSVCLQRVYMKQPEPNPRLGSRCRSVKPRHPCFPKAWRRRFLVPAGEMRRSQCQTRAWGNRGYLWLIRWPYVNLQRPGCKSFGTGFDANGMLRSGCIYRSVDGVHVGEGRGRECICASCAEKKRKGKAR